MEIIRDLYEDDNLFEPSTRDERMTLWNYYYRNVKHPDVTFDFKLVELGIFGSCESSLSSESGDSSGSDSAPLIVLFFFRNQDDHGYHRP